MSPDMGYSPLVDDPEEEKSQFYVNPEIINKWEIQFNIKFEPKFLKDYMLKALEDAKSWPMKKETELSKVRLKTGSDFNPSLPNISHEHLFPEIKDPELILKTMNDFRKEWDD